MDSLACVALVVLSVLCVAWVISNNGKADPAQLITDLSGALGRGDTAACRKLLGKLPDWRVRARLRTAADRTTELRQHAALAAQAGVSPGALGSLRQVISRNESIVITVTRKIVSLRAESGGTFRKLPAPARAQLDQDVRRLEAITRATDTVRMSLAVATASVTNGTADHSSDALIAFGRALRELADR